MSHGGYVGVYVFLVYVVPITLVIGASLAFSKPKARAVIAAITAAVLWCYAIWIAICLFLFPAPLATGLYGLAGLCSIAAMATVAAAYFMKRANRPTIKVR